MCPSLLTDTITKRPAIRIRCGKPARRTAGAGLLYALVALALLICPGAAQVAADGSPQSSGLTRPCAPVAPDTKPQKNPKNPAKGIASPPEEAPLGCLEVKLSALEVQEFLQNFVREQSWTVGQQHSSEDLWTFVRLLDKDELTRVAKADILGGRIIWTEGKGFVAVRTNDAKEGFTRVQISARYQGRGETKESFARPTSFWPLISNRTLESSMIAALESHFVSKR